MNDISTSTSASRKFGGDHDLTPFYMFQRAVAEPYPFGYVGPQQEGGHRYEIADRGGDPAARQIDPQEDQVSRLRVRKDIAASDECVSVEKSARRRENGREQE